MAENNDKTRADAEIERGASGTLPRIRRRLSKNKRLTIVVAAVAVVAVAAVSFGVWSTTPAFCSTTGSPRSASATATSR